MKRFGIVWEVYNMPVTVVLLPIWFMAARRRFGAYLNAGFTIEEAELRVKVEGATK